MLQQANKVLAVPLTRDDVIGVYAGLRPLLSGESESTSQLSREHVVAQPVPGLVLVAGGKYTTYRLMARDAVDAVVHALDWRGPAVLHRPGAAGGRGRVRGALERPEPAGPVVGTARGPDRASAAAVRLAGAARCSP